MKALRLLCVLLPLALALQLRPPLADELPVISSSMVDHINSLDTTWKASTDQGSLSGITFKEARSLMGVLEGGPILPERVHDLTNLQIPEEFDSATNWPHCASLTEIRDQSSCGSCWAFATVEAASDRLCILNNKNITLSAEEMNSCCSACGYGCGGGWPSSAYNYWVKTGLVTTQCSPYSFPSCDHHIPDSSNPCPPSKPTPPCNKTCSNGENWTRDRHFGETAYRLSGVENIQADLMKHGPLSVAFTVYADFLAYKSGVYKHQSGSALGGHAVKLVGWGTENGVKYWKIANSWNENWGDKGYFKIIRGVNECGIETRETVAGIPRKE